AQPEILFQTKLIRIEHNLHLKVRVQILGYRSGSGQNRPLFCKITINLRIHPLSLASDSERIHRLSLPQGVRGKCEMIFANSNLYTIRTLNFFV
ncbi:hypothetical protein, partial [Haemophilus paraphrohaemolyticus]|uniref:hypothetical protein n=1 Tax=Haemophilus paraphrohaemolyticus TaxID=736 RepID=UPI001E45EB35